MAEKVVIDPITRIEGHLRVECEVEGGKISKAHVSATLYRGMETILKGRKPEDAFYVAQRICGVCPISHGHASTQGAEAAMGITIPRNAKIIRNIIEAAQYLHSHILWFYTLTALDYVDVVSALSADVAGCYDLCAEKGLATADFAAIQARLAKFVQGGQLSIFSGNWFGHPAYKLPAEVNLIAVAHYLEALEMQAEAAAVIAVMGGKFPHFMTSVPGGTVWMPTDEKLDDVIFRLTRVKEWIDTRLIPDTLAIAPFYLDAIQYGTGTGNLLSWGVFEDYDDPAADPKKRYMPRGAVYTEVKGVGPVDVKTATLGDADPEKVIEYTEHSWYSSPSSLNPKEGQTQADFTEYALDGKYSWAKAPRHDGKNCEVGPLARMVVAYFAGRPEVKTIVDDTLKALGTSDPGVLFSLLGRVAARNLEAAVVAEWALKWAGDLVGAIKEGDSSFFVTERAADGQGAGLWEAPRGSVGHWMTVKGGTIDNYQVVAPSTWLTSPRDADGNLGPMEAALVGTPIENAEQPLEALRIVHSFDP